MISIDQLLESVDLDFEPRWVTKDGVGEDEDVVIHKERPAVDIESECWDSGFKRKTIGSIKLAEFANKHWTECIYEVPRKTTTDSKKELVGKIEKFDYPVSSPFYIEHNIIMDKINDLIDAVNELKGASNE